MLNALYIAPQLLCVLAHENFLQLPVSVERVQTVSSAKTSKNAKIGVLPASLNGSIYEYFVDFEIGTPPQKNKALLDSASADVWVYGPDSRGSPYLYDPKKSSSSQFVDSDFSLKYADSTSSSGAYYKDIVHTGNASTPLQFAVSNHSFDRYGKFGLAPVSVEADSNKYLNFPAALKQNGIIEVNAFSLFLNNLSASTGSLLLGAVDRSSYTGPLTIVNTTQSNGFFVDVEVDGHKFTAEPDSGTTYSYIPDDILAAFAHSIKAVWDGSKYICSEIPSGASLTYSFSGAEIKVDAEELFIPNGDAYELTVFPNSQTAGMNLLGDSFLRSAYVVYNADDGYIAIAQARYGADSPDIVPITADGIPGAVYAPGF